MACTNGISTGNLEFDVKFFLFPAVTLRRFVKFETMIWPNRELKKS